MKSDTVELEKLRTEGRKKTEQAERLAVETEKQSKGCTDTVSESSCPCDHVTFSFQIMRSVLWNKSSQPLTSSDVFRVVNIILLTTMSKHWQEPI